MSITALKLLKAAAAKGWWFRVDQEDELLTTKSAPKAWELVKEVEMAWVGFYDAAGKKMGLAYLMAPGPNSCDPDETLVDHTCDGGEFEALCDAAMKET